MKTSKKKKESKVRKHKEYLTLLSKAKRVKRRQMLIDLADADEIRGICECVINLLNGNIAIKNKEKNKFKRYKNTLRHIASKSQSTKNKKKILQQQGGFLSALLPLALSAVGSIVPTLFGSK